MCGNIRFGCISRSEKGEVYCEDGTCPAIAGVSGVRAAAVVYSLSVLLFGNP